MLGHQELLSHWRKVRMSRRQRVKIVLSCNFYCDDISRELKKKKKIGNLNHFNKKEKVFNSETQPSATVTNALF